MDEMKHRKLQELDRSDFQIIEGDPDIRGWDVKDATGQKIGEVEELIVDAAEKKVRYMVVDLKGKAKDLKEHPVLIPIGMATLHEKEDDVLLPNINIDQLNKLPEYDRDRLDNDVEKQICTVLGRGEFQSGRPAENSNSGEFYRHDYFNDDNLYKNRLHQAEPVRNSNRETEYDKGLRLWEMRSEGGIISGSHGNSDRTQDLDDERNSSDRIRSRRQAYEERKRHTSEERTHSNREDHSIERRIRDEGLQDG
jgi:PRC-barrel domain